MDDILIGVEIFGIVLAFAVILLGLRMRSVSNLPIQRRVLNFVLPAAGYHGLSGILIMVLIILLGIEKAAIPIMLLLATAGTITIAAVSLGVLLIETSTVYEIEPLQHQAARDPLTGLLNRRGADQVVSSQKGNISEQICVIFLDIDNFKKLNDKHGHKAGDDALQEVTRITSEAIRDQDIVSRYGGEEIVVILPGVTAIGVAIVVAERIRKNIEAQCIIGDGEKRQSVTVSVGVSQPRPWSSFEDAVTAADQAMYAAKQSGKNCVKAEAAVRDR